jgi:hypothetical protein
MVKEKMNFDDYKKAEGLNSTFLRKIASHSIAHALIEKDPTPAMELGRAFHKFALEPDDFNSEYAVAPKFDRRTKAGKESYEIFQTKNDGKTLISEDDFLTISKMTIALSKHSIASL